MEKRIRWIDFIAGTLAQVIGNAAVVKVLSGPTLAGELHKRLPEQR